MVHDTDLYTYKIYDLVDKVISCNCNRTEIERETSMLYELLTPFVPTNILVFPNIFDKFTPVATSIRHSSSLCSSFCILQTCSRNSEPHKSRFPGVTGSTWKRCLRRSNGDCSPPPGPSSSTQCFNAVAFRGTFKSRPRRRRGSCATNLTAQLLLACFLRA